MARTTYRYDLKTAEHPPIDREAYAKAETFLNRLKRYQRDLDYMQWKTLRGQALAGDVEGAERGLMKIIRHGEESGRIKFATDRYQGKGDAG